MGTKKEKIASLKAKVKSLKKIIKKNELDYVIETHERAQRVELYADMVIDYVMNPKKQIEDDDKVMILDIFYKL